MTADTRLAGATCAAGKSERADGIDDAHISAATNGDEAPACDSEVDEPVVFYATNTPNNFIAAAGAHARKNSWEFYQSLLPDLDDDVDLTLTSLAKDLGLSYSILSGIIRAHFRRVSNGLCVGT